MASITGTSVTFVGRAPGSLQQDRTMTTLSSLKSVSFSIRGKTFPSVRLHPMRSCISCAAKPETVDKVAAIVKKQLALPDDTSVTGDSTFSALGADSLDTVEVVMALEEEFGISVEEESAQNIATVQDAADLIEKLVGKKDG